MSPPMYTGEITVCSIKTRKYNPPTNNLKKETITGERGLSRDVFLVDVSIVIIIFMIMIYLVKFHRNVDASRPNMIY